MAHIQPDDSMTAVEKKLKGVYLRYPHRHLDQPCQQEDVQELLESAFFGHDLITNETGAGYAQRFSAMIQEQVFIPEGMDITFVPHMRYMPAFWHRHAFFELLCVLKGDCQNIFYDRTIRMKQGDICIHSPGTVHAVSAFSDEAVLTNILIRKSTFESSFFGLMQGNSILSGFFSRAFYRTNDMPYLLFHAQDDEDITDCILTAKEEEASEHRYKRQMVNLLISQVLLLLLERHEHTIEVADSGTNGKKANIIQVLDYVHAHYTDISLKQLADHFNYSERQLQRIITEATGMPFSKMIQKQKMLRAAALLSESDRSVSSISETVGCPSQNHFRKLFFEAYGMTPSEYRRLHRET